MNVTGVLCGTEFLTLAWSSTFRTIFNPLSELAPSNGGRIISREHLARGIIVIFEVSFDLGLLVCSLTTSYLFAFDLPILVWSLTLFSLFPASLRRLGVWILGSDTWLC